MSIKENLLNLKKSLAPGVTLVAVSKTKPVKMIMEAFELGQKDFGENYVQELTEKYEQLPKDIHWHFIGHLQSNKVKYIAPFVHLIHGVDSFKLLQEINKQGLKQKRVIDCLLQIYIAKEETKFGLSFEECTELLHSSQFSELGNVKVKGFMAMASNTEDERQIRSEFISLKKFSEGFTGSNIPNFQSDILSFGMSSDYKIAMECGSNMVRIGSSIFGERNYNL
jgi:PLP dependent protein